MTEKPITANFFVLSTAINIDYTKPSNKKWKTAYFITFKYSKN